MHPAKETVRGASRWIEPLGGAHSQQSWQDAGWKGGEAPPPRMRAPLCCSTYLWVRQEGWASGSGVQTEARGCATSCLGSGSRWLGPGFACDSQAATDPSSPLGIAHVSCSKVTFTNSTRLRPVDAWSKPSETGSTTSMLSRVSPRSGA